MPRKQDPIGPDTNLPVPQHQDDDRASMRVGTSSVSFTIIITITIIQGHGRHLKIINCVHVYKDHSRDEHPRCTGADTGLDDVDRCGTVQKLHYIFPYSSTV